MLRMPHCTLTPKRQEYHFASGKSLKTSYTFMNSFDNSDYVGLQTTIATRFINGAIDSANIEEVITIPIVPKNVVNDHSCTEYVSKIILDYFGFDYLVDDLAFQLISKGYTKSYGNSAKIDGSILAIDYIINYIADQPNTSQNIRINHFKQILDNLKNGIIVPMRVEDSVYYSDSSKTGGHYVILFALIEGRAYVIDSRIPTGVTSLSTSHLFNAMLANEDSICAWNLSPCYE